jgi:hypothetical protein
MPDLNNPILRSPNQVQKVRGFAQKAEDITVGGQPVKVQRSFPSATVTVLYHTDDNTEVIAPRFDVNGDRQLSSVVTADENAFYEMFLETGYYDLKFSDLGAGVAAFKLPLKVEASTFNVHDYGAIGDNNADDTAAIRAAIEAMKKANDPDNDPPNPNSVGTLLFPNGTYRVSEAIELPSGIVIQGTNSQYSGIDTANCQILLTARNQSIFLIGDSRFKIAIRDIGLVRDPNLDIEETTGIRLAGAAGSSSTQMEFHNVTIWKMEKGIHASSTFGEWECANVRVSQCTIVECNYGIYLDSQNCDFWKIVDCRIGANPGGNGVHLEKVGILAIDCLLGAGNGAGMEADALIYITAAHGTVTIVGCQVEGFENSIRLASSPEGNIAWPIVVLNSTFGFPVLLAHNCDYISLGCRYVPGSLQCVGPHGTDVMIYSFGDIIAPSDPNPEIPLSTYDFELFGNSRVVSRSNRFRVDFQQPARFGGTPGQIATRLEDTALAISPFQSGQPQVALCNSVGAVLYHIRADVNNIYFEDPRVLPGDPFTKLMKLDRFGNLTVRGSYFQDPNL